MRLRAFVVLLAPPTSGVVRPSLSRLGMGTVCGKSRARGRHAADGLGHEGFPKGARMPKPGLLPIEEAILAVTHICVGQALHQRLALEQTRGRVLQAPVAAKVMCDIQAALDQRGRPLDVPWSTGGTRYAEMGAGGACPDEVEMVSRVRCLVVPAH